LVKIIISAGEASGDFYGACLAGQILKTKKGKVAISGFGGQKMKAAGVDVRLDTVSHASMGFWEVFVNIFTHLRLFNQAVKFIRQEKPDMLIVIDSPAFNMPLIEAARKNGIKKIVYYSTPQVWVWKPGRIKILKKNTDLCVVVLPFEEKILKDAGINAKYFGHPMAPYLSPAKPSSRRKLIGIFPGSRKNEIIHFFDDILKTCALIKLHLKKVDFILFQSDTISDAQIASYLQRYAGLRIKVVKGSDIKEKSSLTAAIAKSGTTTLELALMGVPMAVVYRISQLSFMIMKNLTGIKFVSLPNIILKKEVVKEFIQDDFKPENVSREMIKILSDKEYASKMRNNFKLLRKNNSRDSKVVVNIAAEIMREAGL
jgi:lipid-A-disaccharide synthase